MINKGQNLLADRLSALKEISEIIGSTMGVKGRLIEIEYNGYDDRGNRLGHTTTKDGYNGGVYIDYDPVKENTVKHVIDAMSKVMQEAGDGTTTCAVLTYAYAHTLAKASEGRNPYAVSAGAREALRDTITFLEGLAIKADEKTLKQLATISANNNKELGGLIGEMVWKIGVNGATYMKKGLDTKYTIEPGYHLNSGVAQLDFYNTQTMMIYEDCNVILIDERVDKFDNLLQLFVVAKKLTGRQPLIIIASGIAGEAMATILKNMHNPKDPDFPRVGVVNMPVFEKPEMKQLMLEDLRVIFGCGRILGKLRGNDATEVKKEDFGWCKKITATTKDTKITLSEKFKKEIDERVEQALSEKTEFNLKRASFLTTGVGTLYIKASVDSDFKKNWDMAEDAVWASLKALEYNMLPGGGKSLVAAYNYFWPNIKGIKEKSDRNRGYSCFVECLIEPALQLLRLSFVDEKIVRAKFDILLNSKDFWEGFNFRTEEMENLRTNGIYDSAKSTYAAMTHALDAACTIVESKYLIDVTVRR